MKAILLCAGFATRMYPRTRHFPKPLLEVAGRPILDDLVEQLVESGHVNSFQVVSNARFLPHFIEWAATMEIRHPAFKFRIDDDGVLENEARLGAIGDLNLAVEREEPGELALVAAGDNFFRFDLNRLLGRAAAEPRDTLVVYSETDLERQRRTGLVEMDEDFRVTAFHEKPEHPPSEWASPALYLLTRSSLAMLPEFLNSHPGADAPGHFIRWLVTRSQVYAHIMEGGRLDVGDLAGLDRAESWLRERNDPC
jgi:glucose-1-phosphate thymidylyltransferase